MKKAFCLIIALALVFSLAACGNTTGSSVSETAAPEEAPVTEPTPDDASVSSLALTEGVYWIGEKDETGIPFTWIKFYEDGTYYEKDFGGGMLSAGTYELLNEGTEYMEDSDGDKMAMEGDPVKTSEQTVILTDYQTGSARRIAYVDDALVDMTIGNGVSNHRTLLHDTEYPFDENTDVIAIQLFVFYANNDAGANFILNHNRTFEDVTGDFFDDGTWDMTAPGEYELTYSDGSKANLSIQDGGKNASLTRADGTVTELKDDYKEDLSFSVVKQMELRNEEVAVEGLPMSVALRLDAYSDGSAQLVVEIAAIGAELIAETGTFEADAAMHVTFHFEKAGDLAGTPDYAGVVDNTIPITVQYAAEVEPEFNGAPTAMKLDAELTGMFDPTAVGEAIETVAVFTATNQNVGAIPADLTIECYSDGTAVLFVDVAAVGAHLEADKGTYEVDAAANYTFEFEGAGTVYGKPDYTTATESSVEINIDYFAELSVEFMGTVTELTIASTLTGTHKAA